MIPIRDMFVQASKINTPGIEGYYVEKKYVGAGGQGSKLKKPQLKKGSYLEDYNKVHGSVPGPGVYDYAKNLWPEKNKGMKVKPSEKQTYIDEILKLSKKQKRPAPGQYKLQKTQKEVEQQKKQMARKKIHQTDRMTYLDGIQYEASQTPGVGKYNPRERPRSSTTVKKTKPEEWRKKHETDKKKKVSKTPDMGSYNPKQAKSYSKKQSKDGEWGKLRRFTQSKSGSGLGPGKYIPIEDWANKKSVESRVRPKSAYYQ